MERAGGHRQSSSDAILAACVDALKSSNSKGLAECDVDIQDVSCITVSAETVGTEAWERNGKSRGAAIWFVPNQGFDRKRRMVYLHGGGFKRYSPSHAVYKSWCSRLAVATGVPVLAIDYRLAPEHFAPAAIHDVLAAVEFAWDHGPDGAEPAQQVILGGDSSGGCQVFASFAASILREVAPGVALKPIKHERRLPSLLWALSAWTDLTCSQASYVSRAWDPATHCGDPIYSSSPEMERTTNASSADPYVGMLDRFDSRLSPLNMNADLLRQLPPTLLLVGDAEVLLDDSQEFAARALKAGAVDVEIRVYPHMWHCWPMYSMLPTLIGRGNERLAESQSACYDLDAFLQRHAILQPMTTRVAALPSPADEKVCCICLNSNEVLRLWCSHSLCCDCSLQASNFGHRHCPVCRVPHSLNPVMLRKNASNFRERYRRWRSGLQSGASGEVSEVSAYPGWRFKTITSPARRDHHMKQAGVLFVSNASRSTLDQPPGKWEDDVLTPSESMGEIGRAPWRALLAQNEPVKATTVAPLSAGSIYAHCITPAVPPGGWFSRYDRRAQLAVAAHYQFLLCHPIAMAKFQWNWCAVYWPWWLAPLAAMLALPLAPVATYVSAFASEVVGSLRGDDPNQNVDSPFFVVPSDFISRVNAKCYIEMVLRVGSFIQFGSDMEALQHTKKDVICTKEYWIHLLDSVGANRPRQLGLWSNGVVTDVGPGVGAGSCNLVCKIVDAFMGRGDKVFKRGVHFDTSDGAKQLSVALQSDPVYAGKQALLCELIHPISREKLRLSSDGFHNVHSLDILTVRMANGEVKVASCLLWTDCASWTSHSCTAGYTIDVESETIVSGVPWYSAAFAQGGDAQQALRLLGQRVPGVHKACNDAINAHAASDLPWLTSVGWDAMITDDGPVFFEGNLASMRAPRRIFLDRTSLDLWMGEIGLAPRWARQAQYEPVQSCSSTPLSSAHSCLPQTATTKAQAPSLHHKLMGKLEPGHSIVFAWWPSNKDWTEPHRLEEMCMRGLAAVRPGLDCVALPELPHVRRSFSIWCDRFQLQPWQAIWFPPLLDPNVSCGNEPSAVTLLTLTLTPTMTITITITITR